MSMRVSKSRRERSRQQHKTRIKGVRQNRFPATAVITGALLWAAVVVLLYGSRALHHSSLTVGQKAPVTVIASVDFTTQDLAKTELSRRQTADNVQPIFTINETPLFLAIRTLDGLFREARDLRTLQEAEDPAGDTSSEPPHLLPVEPLAESPVTLSLETVLQAAPPGTEEAVMEAMRVAISKVWNEGIVSESDRRTRFQGVAVYGGITVPDNENKFTRSLHIADLRLPREAVAEMVRQVVSTLPNVQVSSNALRGLLEPILAPNLIYEPHKTEVARQSAAREALPETITLRAGATIVEAGERLTDQLLETLRSHEKKQSELVSESDVLLRMAGNASLLLVMLSVCGGLLRMLSKKAFERKSHIVALGLACFLALLLAKGLLYLSASTTWLNPSLVEFLIPLALAPMLAALLVDRASAVVVGIWTSFAAAVMYGNSFMILSIGLVVSMVAVHAMRDVSCRSRVIRAGLWVGLAKMIFVICLALWHRHTLAILLMQSGTALASGFVAALLVLILLPLFEGLFAITTNLRLLELSDMSHPLLRRLAMEAPGTYHHSLMVANLAQAAVSNIDGNALLARVCAYYHDVGKLTKPEFFTENIGFHTNPHDNLAPSMSTLVIRSHVKEGVSLATQYKLPSPIIQSILQHHGTSLVQYFYNRACRQADQEPGNGNRTDGKVIRDEDFRYPGPKPSSPEMAVLMLADSVEAASRSMDKPTSVRIESLVKDIAQDRFQDGQLDECGMSITQLAVVKESLVFTLTNMLHVRTPYPQDEDKPKQPSEETPDPAAAPPTPLPVALEAGAAV